MTADGFQAVRSLALGPRSMAETAPQRGAQPGGTRTCPAASCRGRGTLVAAARSTARQDPDSLAESVAGQLLARWGVVFWDLLGHEELSVPWRQLLWALRRLEARGLVRGGRFVTGFVGEQFALPEAVDHLRRLRRSPRAGEVIRLMRQIP